MGQLKVVMDPEARQRYLDMLLSHDGMSHIKEDPLAAYCPISLTTTPEELKPILQERQRLLMEDVLGSAGIRAYDPASAPYSPDKNLTALPNEVYVVVSGKILGARFFVGHNILSSSGQGVEAEKAKTFNRISVMLMDKGIRVSRMQPHRTIYLEYADFAEEASKFIPVFEMLKQYEPGMGFNGQLPVLLGFGKDGSIVDLEHQIYSEFPSIQYHYQGKAPIIKLRVDNPELFYENKVA